MFNRLHNTSKVIDPLDLGKPGSSERAFNEAVLKQLMEKHTLLEANRFYPINTNKGPINVRFDKNVSFLKNQQDKIKNILILEKEIGKNVFEVVKRYVPQSDGTLKQKNSRYVTKRVENHKRSSNDKFKTKVKKELDLTQKVLHMHCKNPIYVTDNNKKITACYITMRKLEDKTLGNYLNNREKIDFDQATDQAINLLNALEQIHDCGIVHQDLKPDNIIINTITNHFSIFDFNVSVSEGEKTVCCGTPLFLAPEQVAIRYNPAGKAIATQKTDVWAVGLNIALLLGIPNPFDKEEDLNVLPLLGGGEGLDSLCDKIMRSGREFIFSFKDLSHLTDLPAHYKSRLVELLNGLVEFDPAKRLSLTKAIQSLEDIKFERLLAKQLSVEINGELISWEDKQAKYDALRKELLPVYQLAMDVRNELRVQTYNNLSYLSDLKNKLEKLNDKETDLFIKFIPVNYFKDSKNHDDFIEKYNELNNLLAETKEIGDSLSENLKTLNESFKLKPKNLTFAVENLIADSKDALRKLQKPRVSLDEYVEFSRKYNPKITELNVLIEVVKMHQHFNSLSYLEQISKIDGYMNKLNSIIDTTRDKDILKFITTFISDGFFPELANKTKDECLQLIDEAINADLDTLIKKVDCDYEQASKTIRNLQKGFKLEKSLNKEAARLSDQLSEMLPPARLSDQLSEMLPPKKKQLSISDKKYLTHCFNEIQTELTSALEEIQKANELKMFTLSNLMTYMIMKLEESNHTADSEQLKQLRDAREVLPWKKASASLEIIENSCYLLPKDRRQNVRDLLDCIKNESTVTGLSNRINNITENIQSWRGFFGVRKSRLVGMAQFAVNTANNLKPKSSAQDKKFVEEEKGIKKTSTP